ncbi:tRNA (mnm(5)s(2)U34)-methyltransferase, chloroplastic-like protein [Drosera capensis]
MKPCSPLPRSFKQQPRQTMARIVFNHLAPTSMIRHHPFSSSALRRTKTKTLTPPSFHSPKRIFSRHHGIIVFGTTRFSSSSASRISMSSSASIAGKSTVCDAVPEDALMGYIFGTERATEVAHCIWKRVTRKGDIVVDATCGNGYDTLAMLKMVKKDNGEGFVYGMDIQEDAVKSTLSLLDSSLDPTFRQHIKIFTTCHSRMAKVLPKNTSVRLVAFNLGYLPGGDKQLITRPHTTLLALEAAKEILTSGGLISLVVYVGHPGGREEFESVLSFASKLSVDEWFCSQIQLPNRPESPVLMFLCKR